jgi:hypothetical protein
MHFTCINDEHDEPHVGGQALTGHHGREMVMVCAGMVGGACVWREAASLAIGGGGLRCTGSRATQRRAHAGTMREQLADWVDVR